MNRRDFIGAAIGALVVALLLPFEEFAAWCRRWLRPARGGRLFFVSPPRSGKLLASRLAPEDPVRVWLDMRASVGVITKVDRLRGTITVSA